MPIQKSYENLTTCPICKKTLYIIKDDFTIFKECKSKCFLYYYSNYIGDGKYFEIYIFDEEFFWDQYYTEKNITEVKEEIDKKIVYWKTNDRYLLKWMGVE